MRHGGPYLGYLSITVALKHFGRAEVPTITPYGWLVLIPRGTGRKRQAPDAIGCLPANVVNNIEQRNFFFKVLSDHTIFGRSTYNLTVQTR